MQGLEILAYDGARKIYTFNAFDSLGNMASGTMTVKGNTWTTTGTMTMGTTTMRDRCSLEFGAGGATLTMKCGISTDGKTWTPAFEGTAKEEQPVTTESSGPANDQEAPDISCLSTTIFSCDMSSMEAGIPPTP